MGSDNFSTAQEPTEKLGLVVVNQSRATDLEPGKGTRWLKEWRLKELDAGEV